MCEWTKYYRLRLYAITRVAKSLRSLHHISTKFDWTLSMVVFCTVCCVNIWCVCFISMVKPKHPIEQRINHKFASYLCACFYFFSFDSFLRSATFFLSCVTKHVIINEEDYLRIEICELRLTFETECGTKCWAKNASCWSVATGFNENGRIMNRIFEYEKRREEKSNELAPPQRQQ